MKGSLLFSQGFIQTATESASSLIRLFTNSGINSIRVSKGNELPLSSILTQSRLYWKSQSNLLIPRRGFRTSNQRNLNYVQKRNYSMFTEKRIERLEMSASSDPSNAVKQAELYKELNKVDPAAVIQRYESSAFASNDACLKEYITALARLERLDKVLPAISSSFHASKAQFTPPSNVQFQPQQQAFTSSFASQGHQNISPAMLGATTKGTNADPVYVMMQEPGFKSQIWRTVRALALAFLVISAFSTLIEERGLPKGFKEGMSIHTEIEPNGANPSYKFSDVHGVDEAKAELEEIVEFLRDPVKFTRLGGKLPKGVLLVGPPGTGKTLLARAIAGEAGVPFFYCSGSEFDEMFVGVGARRVRELFANAKKRSPCIIFIDEIDAIGGSRNPKDQQFVRMTLNQLLVELDGFNQAEGIIVIGATNFPESLDKALVRPGRFDRHVVVPIPDIKGREQILVYHAKNVPLAKDVDLHILARGTPGLSGADLANLINHAALKASMEGKKEVHMEDFEHAKDKILMGAERKSAVIDEQNRKRIAFHEGGHALVAMYTPGAMPVHKATIMPRGQALGMVAQLPEKDELSWTKKQLIARLDVAMGGRVAEELIFGADEVTSGASSDIESATRVAQAIVMKFGMSEKVGTVLHKDEDLQNLSPQTRMAIENEIKALIDNAKKRAENLLSTHKDELHLLARALLEHETLSSNQIEQVLKGKSIKVPEIVAK